MMTIHEFLYRVANFPDSRGRLTIFNRISLDAPSQ